MKITLKNQVSTAVIDTLGAELQHFIYNEYDYMWSGDKSFWGGRSPVLFPIIGSLNEGKLRINNTDYTMGNHGFARNSEFRCISHNDSRAVFELESTEKTLAQYPYHFRLTLAYTLEENQLIIDYTVNNIDTIPLYFQLGTHPAFNCPMDSKTPEGLSKWYLEFEKEEYLSRVGLKDNLIDLDTQEVILKGSNKLPLHADLFKDTAMVFLDVHSQSLVLKSDSSKRSVKIAYDNLPILAVWQPYQAPFLCLEPWTGHGDLIGFDGSIENKARMTRLDPKETYKAYLTIIPMC